MSVIVAPYRGSNRLIAEQLTWDVCPVSEIHLAGQLRCVAGAQHAEEINE